MLLIGAGQGAALSPLTAAGIAGVARRDAGAASGVVAPPAVQIRSPPSLHLVRRAVSG